MLLQGAKHADVGEPFEAAATEDQGEGSVPIHSLAPAEVGCVTYARQRCKNRALGAVAAGGASRCAAPGAGGEVGHAFFDCGKGEE